MRLHIRRRVRFSAAHSYQNIRDLPAGSTVQPGRVHGHNYTVEVTFAGRLNPATGMVVNITEIDALLKRVVGPLDESFIEVDHPDVAWGIPTTENLALWIWESCRGSAIPADLSSVRVKETDRLWSDYQGRDNRVVKVTRSYEFAAAHRLHSAALSDKENREVFGKCNNPNYHGHNYGLEVTVKGPVDARTGMACDLAALDEIVLRSVVDRFDHSNLNLDVAEFAGSNPTSENVTAVIWSILKPQLGDSLDRICVRETERNYFEYSGEG